MAECYTIPGQPFVAPVPAYTSQASDFGWNAGAISDDVLDGNVRVQFTMPKRDVGCVLGFAPEIGSVTNRERITHGFYFLLDAGVYRMRIVESGVARSAPAPYSLSDVFVIERINGTVAYKVNGNVLMYSYKPSSGPLVVATVLYATGDAAPGAP